MNPSSKLLFLPLLAQMLLTIVVYFGLAVAKARAVKRGLVDLQRRGLHDDAWPESVQKFNHNIRNQFETPVLFYVLILVQYQLGVGGPLAQSLAWLYVVSRVAHAYVHIGSNHVPIRRPLFMVGCVILLAMMGLTVAAVLC